MLHEGFGCERPVDEYRVGQVSSDLEYEQQFATAAHLPASRIMQIDPEAWDKSFTFSVVRNPWDRLVSMWKFSLQKKRTDSTWISKRVMLGMPARQLTAEQAEITRQMLLRKNLEYWIKYCDDHQWNGFPCWTGVTFNDNKSQVRFPQSAWIDGQIDKVFKIEHGEEMVQALYKRFGVEFHLPVDNVSKRKRDWKQYHTSWTQRFVERVCKTDIERFKYTF